MNIQLQTHAKINRAFGEEFANAVLTEATREDMTKENWIGPVRSPYGHHLIRIIAYTPSSPPKFHTVQARVKSDMMEERRRVVCVCVF